MLIDGKKIASTIYDELKEKVLKSDKKITLGVILVGDNNPSIRYIKEKKKWADHIGINFVLKRVSDSVTQDELLDIVNDFNISNKITGFMIQTPLPNHINLNQLIDTIDPSKDVDGFHPINMGKLIIGDNSGFISCTPAGIMEILKSENVNLVGKNVVVIGRSNIVGKPIVNLLINSGATVTCCNSNTTNLDKITKISDVIIVAVGNPGLLKTSMVKHGSVIIDVGFTVIDGKIYGDADTKKIDLMGTKITPVPGGVGPLTVACLMKNTLLAAGIE